MAEDGRRSRGHLIKTSTNNAEVAAQSLTVAQKSAPHSEAQARHSPPAAIDAMRLDKVEFHFSSLQSEESFSSLSSW
jgi:hypothetical protein